MQRQLAYELGQSNCITGASRTGQRTTKFVRRVARSPINMPSSSDFKPRPELSDNLLEGFKDVGVWKSTHIPVVYSERYNFRFFGVEKLHPFDSCKFRTVVNRLVAEKLITEAKLVQPREATDEVLLDVHDKKYLEKLAKNKWYVTMVVELAPLLLFPNFVVQNRIMVPMRYHASGTMLAAALAVERGWGINLGGGMHHACYNEGMGWCFYSDIYLAIRRVRKATQGAVQKVLVIDLDVHQGNGIGRDKLHFNDPDLFILDLYNKYIFPNDVDAKAGIDVGVGLGCGETDEKYLARLEGALESVREKCDPDFVFFNAGTDVLEHDPLGRIMVSPKGVVKRDEMVFEFAAELGVPICMVLSGGYTRKSADVISASIANLIRKFDLLNAEKGAEK